MNTETDLTPIRNPQSTIRNRLAFTLIELMVVITIIGLLAALVTGLAGVAGTKRKVALVDAEKHKLIAAIDTYHDKLGFYPPDNTNNPAQNQLFYELTAASLTNINGTIYFIDFRGTKILQGDYSAFFRKGGVANSGPEAFSAYGAAPKPNQYAEIPDHPGVVGLTVPVDLTNGVPNFWCYDSSSINRHNPDSYDLWAVFSTGKTTVTNGNWPQQ